MGALESDEQLGMAGRQASTARVSASRPTLLSILICGLEARESLAHWIPRSSRPRSRASTARFGAPAPSRAFHLLLVALAAEAATPTPRCHRGGDAGSGRTRRSSWTALGYACQRSDPVRRSGASARRSRSGADPRAQGITVLLANAYSKPATKRNQSNVPRGARGPGRVHEERPGARALQPRRQPTTSSTIGPRPRRRIAKRCRSSASGRHVYGRSCSATSLSRSCTSAATTRKRSMP